MCTSCVCSRAFGQCTSCMRFLGALRCAEHVMMHSEKGCCVTWCCQYRHSHSAYICSTVDSQQHVASLSTPLHAVKSCTSTICHVLVRGPLFFHRPNIWPLRLGWMAAGIRALTQRRNLIRGCWDATECVYRNPPEPQKPCMVPVCSCCCLDKQLNRMFQ